MIVLTIRTDKPEAELGLYDNQTQQTYDTWTAHRKLAETIHVHIRDLLQAQAIALKDIEGIVVFQGPGSFTGLRIGITVANALAQGLDIPIVASQNPNWIETGVEKLILGDNDKAAKPFYGAPVHITAQKK